MLLQPQYLFRHTSPLVSQHTCKQSGCSFALEIYWRVWLVSKDNRFYAGNTRNLLHGRPARSLSSSRANVWRVDHVSHCSRLVPVALLSHTIYDSASRELAIFGSVPLSSLEDNGSRDSLSLHGTSPDEFGTIHARSGNHQWHCCVHGQSKSCVRPHCVRNGADCGEPSGLCRTRILGLQSGQHTWRA